MSMRPGMTRCLRPPLGACRALGWLFGVGCAGGLARDASAADKERVAVVLRFMAPAGCPGAESFWGALEQRLPQLRRSRDGEGMEVSVDIERSASRWYGRLRVSTDSGDSEPRMIQAESCAEVVEGLALASAMSLEWAPVSSAGTRETRSDEPDYQPAADALDAGPRPKAVGGGMLAMMPVTGALAIGAEVAWELRVGLLRRSLVRVSVGAARSGWVGGHSEALFTLASAGLAFCPGEVDALWVKLQPCVAGTAGQLSAQGRNLDTVRSADRLWVTAGLEVRGTSRLSTSWQIHWGAGGRVPFLPQRYAVGRDDRMIAETPALVPWAAIGLAYHWD